jgi:hypothetical protein
LDRSGIAADSLAFAANRRRHRDQHRNQNDFCAFENAKGLMVVAPDLVKGQLRFVQLGK